MIIHRLLLFETILFLVNGQIQLNHDIMIQQFFNRIKYVQQSTFANHDNVPSITDSFMRISAINHKFSDESSSCQKDLTVLIDGLNMRQLWALKIIDSWGKPIPSGLLKGNVLWTGNYDECLEPLYQIQNKSFLRQPIDTKYCMLMTDASKVGTFISSSINIGLCLPASCNQKLLSVLFQELLNSTQWNDSLVNCPTDVENQKTDRNVGLIITCFILISLFTLVSVGTIIDIVLRLRRSTLSEMKKSYVEVLAEFSSIRTIEHIFNTKKKNDHSMLTFINGIRVLALFWVIFGHTFLFAIYYTSNTVDVLAWSHNFFFQLISSGVLSVDTFFVLSGFLTTILFLRETAKKRITFRFIALYYIHRYLRLTPTFILVMLISMYLTPFLGHGPLYPIQQGFESDDCHRHYWWTSFLYIGNLIKPQGICLSVSWYLLNDMQFHWIAPAALVPYTMGRKKVAFVVATSFVLISIASTIVLFIRYPDINPNMVQGALEQTPNSTGPTYFDIIYATPWCRIAPYAIGILTGFIVTDFTLSIRISRKIKLIISIVVGLLMFTCIFSLYQDYILINGLNRTSLIMYEALSRTAWGLAISWLIFICSVGHGGIVEKILSWSIWSPLTKLNYATYLTHLTVVYITVFSRTMPYYYQPMTVIHSFISQLFLSYLVAIPVVVFIETPFAIAERILFKRIK